MRCTIKGCTLEAIRQVIYGGYCSCHWNDIHGNYRHLDIFRKKILTDDKENEIETKWI